MLRADAGQLCHAVQVFKGIGVAFEVSFLQKLFQTQFDAGGIHQVAVFVAALHQGGSHFIGVGIFLDQRIHGRIALGVDHFYQVADAV
jgi:hypothetical protein